MICSFPVVPFRGFDTMYVGGRIELEVVPQGVEMSARRCRGCSYGDVLARQRRLLLYRRGRSWSWVKFL